MKPRPLRPGQRVRIDQPSHARHGSVGVIATKALRDGYWVRLGGSPYTSLWPRSWLKVERVKGAKR